MNRPLLPLLLLLLLTARGLPLPALAGAPSEGASAARTAALDVAGAFANDGFKLRDGFWPNRLERGAVALIVVNLFAGNHYWFSVAASDGAQPAVELFNEQGQRVDTDAWKDAGRAAAGVSTTISGPYYVRIQLTEGGPADFCLVYSYK